jgi:hypothetical protein
MDVGADDTNPSPRTLVLHNIQTRPIAHGGIELHHTAHGCRGYERNDVFRLLTLALVGMLLSLTAFAAGAEGDLPASIQFVLVACSALLFAVLLAVTIKRPSGSTPRRIRSGAHPE